MRLIDADKLHLKLLDMEFPIQDQDQILDAMDDCAVDPPPNDPLTLEQLREIEGEPVYLYFVDGGEWVLLRKLEGKIFITHSNTICSPVNLVFMCGGKIYRRKPDEGETWQQ